MGPIRLFAALTVLWVAAVAGCGGETPEDDDNALGDPFTEMPPCSEVWQEGKTLDLDTYEGCRDDDHIELAVTSGCHDENGEYRGQVATYQDELWVLQTGTDPETGEGGTPGEVTRVPPEC